jgi:hypothetical protein
MCVSGFSGAALVWQNPWFGEKRKIRPNTMATVAGVENFAIILPS